MQMMRVGGGCQGHVRGNTVARCALGIFINCSHGRIFTPKRSSASSIVTAAIVVVVVVVVVGVVVMVVIATPFIMIVTTVKASAATWRHDL